MRLKHVASTDKFNKSLLCLTATNTHTNFNMSKKTDEVPFQTSLEYVADLSEVCASAAYT